MSLYHKTAGIDHLERLAGGDTVIHRLHPLAKILAVFVYVAVIVSFPSRNLSGLAAYLFFPAILFPLSLTPPRAILPRLLAALPFALMGGLANLFLLRDTVFYLGPLGVTAGMLSFCSIMLKTALSVSAVLLLAATTPFTGINQELGRLGMPKLPILQFVMTWRYLTVLMNEAAAMSTARLLRAPGRDRLPMGDMGSFLGQLLIRSFDRAERVYRAMKCRGFDGVYHGGPRRRFRPADAWYTALVCGPALALRFFNLGRFLGMLFRGLAGAGAGLWGSR
ncbi:MAG: cobalt ECF transporter T component CbiQ [Treponema sp.]|nr:cobalt ECF transporter T component CbiQ [Treponema sp.]